MACEIDTNAVGINGRKVAHQARRLDMHPNTLIRHIRIGKKLRDGSMLRMRATLQGGYYRIRDEDADAFYAALTANRINDNPPASAPVASESAATWRRYERTKAELDAAGW